MARRKQNDPSIPLAGPAARSLAADIRRRGAEYEKRIAELGDELPPDPPTRPRHIEAKIAAATLRHLHMREEIGVSQFVEATDQAEREVLKSEDPVQ